MADEKNNKSVTESVLGDMFGLTVDKKPAPDLPEDEIALEVLEDRTRLMVQGILYLLLAFAALTLTFFFWVYANVSGNILGLVGVIAGLTITWFASRWESALVVLPAAFTLLILDRKTYVSLQNPTREKHLSFLIPRLKATNLSDRARLCACFLKVLG